MKRLLFALLVLTPHLLLAQPSAEELEARGDVDAALDAYRASLRLARETDEKQAIVDNLLAIGRIHFREGRLDAAAETLRRALAAATEAGGGGHLESVHLALAETYAALGRYQEAYAELRLYDELRGAAATEEMRGLAAEIDARSESARRELEDERRGAIDQRQRRIDELEKRLAQLTRLALAGGAVLLLLLTYSLYSRRRIARKASEVVAERPVEPEQAATELEQLEARDRREIDELEKRHAVAKSRLAEMERFASTVSRDLKSPLIAIRGFLGSFEADMAAGDGAGDGAGHAAADEARRMRREVQRIHDAVEKIAQLLEKLLELSRIGREVEEAEDVWMSELAREAVERLAGRLAERRVEVVIAPDLPTVSGDRVRLLEALSSLIENAIKFMGDQPSPRLEIASRRQGGETVFYVRDNGIGIDPRYHGMVFGLFVRLHQGKEGLGVGLDLVKRVVEAHGGRVWVESAGEGRGSTFYFTVPGGGQSSLRSRTEI